MPFEKTQVERAQAGEAGAFEELYRQQVGRVYALCLRLSGDPSRAEELTQEAFVRAFERIGQFRGESSFGSWLHRLAVNVAMGSRRSRHREESRLRLVTDDQDLEIPAETLEARPDDGIDLERAIANLPARARMVFVLHDVEGFGHQEIADTTGLAVGTSKSQLHRARRLLRGALLSKGAPSR